MGNASFRLKSVKEIRSEKDGEYSCYAYAKGKPKKVKIVKNSVENQIESPISIGLYYPATPPLDKTPNLNGVILYEDRKYNTETPAELRLLKVRSQEFALGDFNLPFQPTSNIPSEGSLLVLTLGVRPNTVNSIKVGEGYYVELFSGFDQTGEKIKIDQNSPIMPKTWNKRIKSIRVCKAPQRK